MLCNRGTPSRCEEGFLNKQPQVLSFFIAIFFKLTGVSDEIARKIMMTVSALSAIALFFLVYLLVKKEEPALYSSLILALTPIHILWASTVTGEPLFVFFSILALTMILVYLNNKSFSTLILAMALLAFASQIRPESPLLLPIAGLFFFKEKLDKKLLVGFILLIVLFSPYVFQFNNISDDSWGSDKGKKISAEYFEENSSINSKFFIENARYPLIFSIISLFGIIYLIINKEYKNLILILSWLLIFFGMFTIFYAGSFNFGVDVRYSMTIYAPISILVGLGLYFMRIFIPVKNKSAASSILILAILISFSFFIPLVLEVGEESWQARNDHDFSIESTKKFGTECTVFANTPSIFLVNGNNALQTHFALNTNIANNVFRKSDCVLFIEDYWCLTAPAFKDNLCKQVKNKFDLEVLNRKSVNDLNFTVYKLSQKKLRGI